MKKGIFSLMMALLTMIGVANAQVGEQTNTRGIENLYVSCTGWAMWDMEGATSDLQGYKFACTTTSGDTIISTTTTNPFLQIDDTQLTIATTYKACVAPIYSTGNGEWAEAEWVFLTCSVFQNPESVEAESDDNGQLVSWAYKTNPVESANIQYSSNSYANCVGLGDGIPVYWGIKLTEAQLNEHVGKNLTKVGLYISVDGSTGAMYTGNYTARVYQGGENAPGTLVAETSATLLGNGAWHDIVLDTPVAIDPSQNLWLTFFTEEIGYPMSYCAPTGASEGDYLSQDGTSWSHAATVGMNLTWMIRGYVEEPATPLDNIIGAMIFRDGEWIAEVPSTQSTYFDEDLDSHEYCVRIIYDGSHVLPNANTYYAMSCPMCATTAGSCAPGADIRGEYVWNENGDYGVLVSWGEKAEPVEEWLHYDDGALANTCGAGANVYWGIMFTPEQLQQYAGSFLTKVALLEYQTGGTYTVNIYYGGITPKFGMLVHSQDFTTTGTLDWMYVDLTAPLPIDPTQNLWITFHQNGLDFPVTGSADSGNPNGRWISTNGIDWIDAATANLNFTWMIRGFVTNQAKGGSTIAKYNVYRSNDNTDYSLVGSVNAIEGVNYYEYYDQIAAGEYYYQVRAEYTSGCESEPAQSEAAPENDYIVVNVTSVAENSPIALYPNPTNGYITISAQNINRVTVLSVLGQVVYDAQVEGNEIMVNMAQFNTGVYMVRIATENGISTQRVNVVK